MSKEIDPQKYQKHYSESSFWKKLGKYAAAAGKGIVEKALQLYYVIRDSDAPTSAKTIAIGALGYFILPFDLIPDFIPAVGYTDDLAAIATSLYSLAKYITPEIKEKAAKKLHEWFGRNQPDGQSDTLNS